MKYSVACCFLTHNHPSVMREILDISIKEYYNHQIDVLIYDDSDDDSTKEIVKRFQKDFNNLFYIDAHIALNGDHKHLLVLQGYGLPKDYDYLWVCKDRVCFSSSYLDRLCSSIDEGHDVILGGNEYQRWNTGNNINSTVYSDPALFYRNYALYTTNWEAVIRKRTTMLKEIDWDLYKTNYNIDENNNFIQPLTLFVRLSELEDTTIKICRYEVSERFISSNSSSAWEKNAFTIWIDKWVAANFSLPSIYDSYKTEAIKSETNCSELFGSVEHLIEWNSKGIFTEEIFEKYKKLWPFISEIPIFCAEMISRGIYKDALLYTIDDFEQAISLGNFERACWIITSNSWFNEVYDKTTYIALKACFNYYRKNRIQTGVSTIFEGINSIQSIVNRYDSLLNSQ